ncbi:MAG: hypothetical protein TR69_WS6001000537 [candidate division WS6 bacterium OLB20]|uniref:Uncharacterized protein n=1 Tax=candidate division WS6 bacterium OLB20 TaxID=1617426 RepID=A0A136LXZ3_9BACT|nr:MAG: hypothetical protein TR69_WS6001000537 [candidate division WS6 bacterium OLB20]
MNAKRNGLIKELGDDDGEMLFKVLQTAGRIGNLGGRLKISQRDPVWFPVLDHATVISMLGAGYRPEQIEEEIEHKFLSAQV